jgi:hypothetical protein
VGGAGEVAGTWPLLVARASQRAGEGYARPGGVGEAGRRTRSAAGLSEALERTLKARAPRHVSR